MTFLTVLRQQKTSLAERYGVESLEVFGSYVRGEQKSGSDLDVLVTFREAPSLLTFLRMENDLSDALGVKVDLVMKDSLKPAIGENILREAERNGRAGVRATSVVERVETSGEKSL